MLKKTFHMKITTEQKEKKISTSILLKLNLLRCSSKLQVV
jgi:hypothetical protein